MPPTTILAVSYFFHLIATVVWIGGLVTMMLLVLPIAQRTLTDQPGLERFVTQFRRRFTPLTNFSLVVLIFTGFIQMTGDSHYDGVLQFTNEWTRVILLKHIAVGGMLLFGLALQFWVTPALERAQLLVERGKGDIQESARLRRNEMRLTWLNVALGVAVLAFTAWATAL